MYVTFIKAIRDSRMTILWLCIGLGLYALFVGAFFPSIAEQGEELNEVYDSMPDEMMSLFGAEDGFDLTDPVTFLNVEFLTWAILIIGAIVMLQAFNAVTNAERNGTMDVMMSLPISRRDMLVGRFLNSVATLVIVFGVSFGVLLLDTKIWPVFDIGVGDLLGIMINGILLLLAYTAFTYFLVTVVPSSKKWAGIIAYVAFFGAYFLHGLLGASDALAELRPLLLFDYFNAPTIARDGLDIVNLVVLLAVAVIFGGLAWWRIDEKELGV
jgi:ABC-type transport system involved in multi-copper enzyme maturation permease subunit